MVDKRNMLLLLLLLLILFLLLLYGVVRHTLCHSQSEGLRVCDQSQISDGKLRHRV